MRLITSNLVPKPRGTYSQAVLIDPGKQLLFISGQVAIREDGAVPESTVEQAEMVWTNIRHILDEADMKIAHIVKLWTGLTDIAYSKDHAAVRTTFLGHHRPASTLVVVPALADPRLKLEVECIAAR